MKVLIPEYLENFQCIGSACEDTCCIGWDVIIDENTNSKYKKILGSNYSLNIKSKKRNGNNEYRIIMDKNRICPFLRDDKLCSIHSDFGPSFLSETCNFYPRITNLLFNSYEQSGTLSCPEIARLALLPQKGINFKEIDISTIRKTPNNILCTNITSSIFLNTFWDIRIFCIQILKTREYSIEERLMTIGIFLNDIQYSKSEIEIKEKIEFFSSEFNSFNILTTLNTFSDDKKILQLTLLHLVIFKSGFDSTNETFLSLINTALQNFNISYDDLKNFNFSTITIEQYNYFIKIYNDKIIKKFDYILENFLVNEVFKDLFPFTKYGSFLNSYINLVSKFIILRTILIGLVSNNELLENDIVNIIQKFSKSITHDTPLQKSITDFIHKLNYDLLLFSMAMLKI